MENINNTNFEQFLRESIEDFKMMPARKVWYGIYNNMHPDRKWPSLVVCFVILAAILFVGVANNNVINKNTQYRLAQNNTNTTTDIYTAANVLPSNTNNAAATNTNPTNENNTQASDVIAVTATNATNTIATINNSTGFVYQHTNDAFVKANSTNNNLTIAYTVAEENSDTETTLQENNKVVSSKNNKLLAKIKQTAIDNNAANTNISLTEINTATTKNNTHNTTNSINAPLEEKAWKEDYAFKNKPKQSQFKQRSSWNYYVTPSYGFRSLIKLRDTKTLASSSSISGNNNNTITNINDQAALNLEMGAAYQYQLNELVRLKFGAQINYTNFISKVTNLKNSAVTEIAVINQRFETYKSNYTTTDGGNTLNRTNWQVAFPVGADFKILGNDKINWHIGATVQPTYTFAGSNFVLSPDEKYYVAENSLLRKFNINTAIETFVSYKTSGGVLLNVGPQFRYQTLSTYKSQYNYAEKLYNIGVKIGIVTSF
jgi:hypothetical protein